jgi:hypothetical protein
VFRRVIVGCLNLALCLLSVWMALSTLCLIRGARNNPSMRIDITALGLCMELVGLALLYLVINRASRFVEFLNYYVSSSMLRACVFILPIVCLWLGPDIVATGLYNAGLTISWKTRVASTARCRAVVHSKPLSATKPPR